MVNMQGKPFVLDDIKGYAFEYQDGSIWVQWGTLSCDICCLVESSRKVILQQINKA